MKIEIGKIHVYPLCTVYKKKKSGQIFPSQLQLPRKNNKNILFVWLNIVFVIIIYTFVTFILNGIGRNHRTKVQWNKSPREKVEDV